MHLLSAVALILASTTALAIDAPTRGLVFNTKEDSSMTYSCESGASGQLECEFVQVAIRRLRKASELGEALSEARTEFSKGGARLNPDECRSFETLLAIMEGKKAAPKSEALAAMPAYQRRDTAALSRAAVGFCKGPTEANWLAFRRVAHDKDTRTCTVSTNKFNQTFQQPQDSGGRVWIVQSKPDGVCGALQAGRFEADVQSIGGKPFSLWKYVAKRVITNPSGMFYPGVPCSSFDQGEYEYDWKDAERALACEYVKFSPL